MDCIAGAQIYGAGKSAYQRLHAKQEKFGNRDERPNTVLDIGKK